MGDVVITAGCRTAIGALGGQYKTMTALDLSIPVMQNLVQRAGIDPASIEDVIWDATTSAPTWKTTWPGWPW